MKNKTKTAGWKYVTSNNREFRFLQNLDRARALLDAEAAKLPGVWLPMSESEVAEETASLEADISRF